MAGSVVTDAHRPLVGVIPCADRSGSIGGAPPPLLQTGSGTFLERAIALLRIAGVDPLVVAVRDRRDPVAAQALRAGATVVQVAEGAHDPAASLRAAEAEVRVAEANTAEAHVAEARPGDPAPPATDAPGHPPAVTFLYLPPTYPLLRDDTMVELARAWRGAVPIPMALAPALPGDSPRSALPWWELAPLFLRGPDPAARLAEGSAAVVQDVAVVRADVVDPGVAERIDTLPLYRRHFPQAFRKRFQKW